MRTTIEMRDDHRARLLELAARRGEKGFSTLVGEAIEAYLDQLESQDQARLAALAVRGALSDDEAEELATRTQDLRERWR